MDNLWNVETHPLKLIKQWKNEELSQHRLHAEPRVRSNMFRSTDRLEPISQRKKFNYSPE